MSIAFADFGSLATWFVVIDQIVLLENDNVNHFTAITSEEMKHVRYREHDGWKMQNAISTPFQAHYIHSIFSSLLVAEGQN